MDVSYGFHVLVGVQFSRVLLEARLYDSKTLPTNNCSHTIPLGAVFCPECGERALMHDETPIKAFDEDKEKVCGLTVIREGESERAYVGISLAECPDLNYNPTAFQIPALATSLPMPGMKEEVHSKLSALGLWNEKNFGLWVVGTVS